MEYEKQPTDRSELATLPPRTRLRLAVARLATFVDRGDPPTILSGMVRLGRENSLAGRTFDLATHFGEDLGPILPDHIFELAVYDRRGNMVEALMIGDGVDDTLLVRKGKKEFLVHDEQADEYILGFAERHNIPH